MSITFKKLAIGDAGSPILVELVSLSERWAAEHTAPAITANQAADFLNKEVFIARDEDEAVAYALGIIKTMTAQTSYNQPGESVFDLEELYVLPTHRKKGLGRALYQFIEDSVAHQVVAISVVATSHRYQDLLRFYIEELGMDFKYAVVAKRLEKDK